MVENHGLAPLYTLRKDHKPCQDEVKGPKTRPVCGGASAYNRKFSHLISMIIRPLWQEADTVATNTEEMMAAFQDINAKEITNEILVGSADVKALYPSLEINHTAEIVSKVFYESDYNIEEVNNRELSLYLALNLRKEELEKENISKFCHKRKSSKGAPPKITGCAIKNNITHRYEPWVEPEEEADSNTTKKMLSVALKVAIKFIMNNHIYSVNGTIKKQTKGGPIGLELTGDIAQIYMCWWDKEMKRRLFENHIILLIYLRYVDDMNFVIDKQKQITENKNEEERKKEDLQIMEKIRKIGNEIHKSIEIETDTPAMHEDNKQPILDLKVWPETRKEQDGRICSKVVHEFYHKEIGNKAVTNAKSAMSMQSKRNILTAEMLRVLLRCSPLLDWNITAKHASEMNRRMQHSGYNHQFRKQVTSAALNKYKNIVQKDKTGECPRYRNKEWKKHERNKKKQQNKTKWFKKGKANYKAVIFVPATPNSELQKQYNKVIKKHKVNIKVIEKAGKQIKTIFQKSDPFKPEKCQDTECFPCQTNNNGKSTNCRKDGIVYQITCNKCPAIYIGESARNANCRGREHLNDHETNKDCSVMQRHTQLHHKHDTHPPKYTMTVKQIYANKCMERQISESIQINNMPFIDRINTKIEHIQNRLPRPSFTYE